MPHEDKDHSDVVLIDKDELHYMKKAIIHYRAQYRWGLEEIEKLTLRIHSYEDNIEAGE